MGKRNLKTDAQLVAEGYRHVQTRRCSYHPCTAQIEVWRTKDQRLMPFDRLTMPVEDARALGLELNEKLTGHVSLTEPHFGTCKGLATRKAKRASGESQEQEPEATGPSV